MLVATVTAGLIVIAGIGSGAWVPAAAAIGVAALAAMAFRRLRGTTLAAPAVWAGATSIAIASVEIAVYASDAPAPLTVSLGRYAAAVGAFCPLMAVLGAKRPQDRGWQWVVLSLWIIMLVPAMQAVAARSGQQLQLFGAWRLLIWCLVAMGLLNYLPTRFALPAVLASVGQTLLLAPYLFDRAHLERWRALGPVALFAAGFIAMLIARMRPPEIGGNGEGRNPLQTFNDRWLCIRDGWGAFWGLRILQRVNQTAELSDWPVRLEWSRGFVSAASEEAAPLAVTLDEHTSAHIEQTLDSLLRRFERF